MILAKWEYRGKKYCAYFSKLRESRGCGDFIVDYSCGPNGSTGIKNLAAQKIWVVTFSFQGGDFIPLLAKLAHTNIHTGSHHQHLGDW